MNILVKRIAKRPTYTIGKLYIDGKYFCDTIEDKDRGLTQNMPLSEIKKKKGIWNAYIILYVISPTPVIFQIPE